MNADIIAYLDTSALAKWYLNEQNSDEVMAKVATEMGCTVKLF